MTEDFLYYIWQFKLFENPIKTFDGELIYVKNPGQRNTNAGPDFLNASLKIGKVSWHGNVEIHVKTSDWHLHGHDFDPNYQKLILHLVYHHDVDKIPHDCPLVEVQNKIPKEIFDNFRNLQLKNQFIPCENLFYQVDEFTKSTFVESLYIQRLEEKSKALNQRLEILQGDWEALTFEYISYVFGLKINSDAFQILAKSFPFKTLQQIQRKNENLESFLFGQAGFLHQPKDEFQQELNENYHFLKHKYATQPISNELFKFLRLRPPNFPTIRISQLANLYQSQNNLFSKFLAANNLNEFQQIFKNAKASEYWNNHYTFGKISKKEEIKYLTDQRIHLILINAILPIKFLHAKKYGAESFEDIVDFVRSLETEENAIIKNFRKIGAKVANALESQAYIELKKNYCDPKKCLNCRIGNKIIHHVR